MTNTPIPQNARRQIVELANMEYQRLLDFSFQIALDSAQDLPASDDDDENEETIKNLALEVLNAVVSRIKLQAMLEIIS